MDAAVAGDDAVAGHDLLLHAEVLAAVRDQLVDLLERAGIEQPRHALAGGQLALLVLFLQPRFATAQFGEALAFAQPFDRVHDTGNPKGLPPRTGC